MSKEKLAHLLLHRYIDFFFFLKTFKNQVKFLAYWVSLVHSCYLALSELRRGKVEVTQVNDCQQLTQVL